MKAKTTWPTLEGRLNQPLITEEEALLQLEQIGGVTFSEKAIKKLERIKKRQRGSTGKALVL